MVCPPEGETPTVTFTVNLSKVTDWDLELLANRFKGTIRWLRGGLAGDLKKPPSQRPGSDLTFLRTCSEETFARDLRRFDLHMANGLTFRQIAELEVRERRGEPVPKDPLPRPVNKAVPGEDAVETSVQRIFQAIHRKPYRARRRRLDAPGEGVERFSCPIHPAGDCDWSCPELQRWEAKVNRTLPSKDSGDLPGKIRFPADQENSMPKPRRSQSE